MSENTGAGSARSRVVVGVDGSQDSRRAVAYGARHALRADADLLLVHAVDDAVLAGAWGVVYDPDLLRESGEHATDDARAFAREAGLPDERVSTEVHMGSPGAVLTRLSEDAEVVVVGRRAMSGLERLFVGSTSAGLAASSHCPTIMVSAASHKDQTGDLGVVGVGVDATERGREALLYAFHEAAERGARLEVVHAFELPHGYFTDAKNRSERSDAHVEAARRGITELLAPLREQHPEVEVATSVVPAHPVDELVGRSARYDLLVVGVHGLSLPGFSPSATIRALMAHGHCPLALVRHYPPRRH